MINMSKVSNIIGRNIARLKFAQSYFVIFASMITAISTLTIALNISIIYWFFLLPITTFFIWLIGYIIDKKGIYESYMTKTLLKNLEAQKIIYTQLWNEIIIPLFKKMFTEIINDLKNKKEVKE